MQRHREVKAPEDGYLRSVPAPPPAPASTQEPALLLPFIFGHLENEPAVSLSLPPSHPAPECITKHHRGRGGEGAATKPSFPTQANVRYKAAAPFIPGSSPRKGILQRQ